MSLLVSKATGATKAYLTDILDHRLAIGKEVGADEVFNVKGLSPEEAAKIIVDKCGGAPDIAIECCGFQPSIELAIKVRLHKIRMEVKMTLGLLEPEENSRNLGNNFSPYWSYFILINVSLCRIAQALSGMGVLR